MGYLAKVEGSYRHRTRINLILFSIVGPWKSETFSFEKTVSDGTAHWAWQPVKNVPIAAAVDLAPEGATFSLQVLTDSFPIKHVSFPAGGAQSFHFEPVKGNILEGTARVSRIA